LDFPNSGGIAGDFPICVVPMLYQDMEMQKHHFGAISAKFQIQLPVTVRILELFE
jgi:hypothetical protein